MRLVLASTSPSRLSILRSAGVDPVTIAPIADENKIVETLATKGMTDPVGVVSALAQAKAESVAEKFPDDIVIGCDSMLLLDGTLQGKPKTVATCIKRWQAQRGKTAQLITGHHVMAPVGLAASTGTTFESPVDHSVRAVQSLPQSTFIHFATPTDADIKAYAETGEPLQCAGAFTLEAIGGWFIDSIEGDPSSVIGLSLPALRQALYTFGLHVADIFTAMPEDTSKVHTL